MPSGTFVLFSLHRFPERRARNNSYKTEERRPRGSVDDRSDPVYTSISLSPAGEHAVADFGHAVAVHRKGVRIEGWWHGNQITQVVQQRRFDIYFDHQRALFVAHVEKEIALSAVRDLVRDDETREHFDLRPIEVDFRQIIPRALNVIGSWFKDMTYTNVRTEAAFGDHITRDAEFMRMSQLGNHSNLTVVMDFRGQQMKVNISRIGSAYFMADYPLEDCLEFMVMLHGFRIQEQANNQ